MNRPVEQPQDATLATSRAEADSGGVDLADLESKMDKETAAVIIQSPNFFGILEPVREAAEMVHRHGALLIAVFTEAVSLGILRPVEEADIIAGELICRETRGEL